MIPPQKSVLILAPYASYRTAAFVSAAKSLGYRPLIATTGRALPTFLAEPGVHLSIDDETAAMQQLLDFARDNPLDGVLATDDSTSELAAGIASVLHLPGNPVESVRRCCSKAEFRRHIARMDSLAAPRWSLFERQRSADDAGNIDFFPVVVKPVHGSASRGVIRADNAAELRLAIERIRRMWLQEENPIIEDLLVEAYVDGPEVAVEACLQNGRLHILCIFDKPEPLAGPFFEETIYVTPSSLADTVQHDIEKSLQRICRHFELQQGILHAEFRIGPGGHVYPLELALRTIGGECAHLFSTAFGFSLEQLLLQLLCGEIPELPGTKGACGVLMLPVPGEGVLRRVEGLQDSLKLPTVYDVRIDVRTGDTLIPWPEGCRYPGFVYAMGGCPDAVRNDLFKAKRLLKLVIGEPIPLRVA